MILYFLHLSVNSYCTYPRWICVVCSCQQDAFSKHDKILFASILWSRYLVEWSTQKTVLMGWSNIGRRFESDWILSNTSRVLPRRKRTILSSRLEPRRDSFELFISTLRKVSGTFKYNRSLTKYIRTFCDSQVTYHSFLFTI